MDTTTIILVAVVLIVIAAAVYFVRRSSLGVVDSDDGARKILDQGWQFYFTPTSLEPPGTVFRIDSNNRRYIVDTLTVETQTGEEAFGDHTESVSANMGIVANFMGLKNASLNVGSNKVENITFKMENPVREVVNDLDLEKVLNPFLADLEFRVDNRYFVIRESRKASAITHHLTRNQVEDLGGEASLNESISAQGTVFKSDRAGEFLLEKAFDQPMRVMFLPEEIRVVSRGLAGEKPELGRVPVSEPLVFEDA